MDPLRNMSAGRAPLFVLLAALGLGVVALLVALRGWGADELEVGRGATVEALAPGPSAAGSELRHAQPVAPAVSAVDGAARESVAIEPTAAAPLDWSGVVSESRTGAGVDGARVELRAGERTTRATSAADGSFALTWPGGPAALEVTHPEFVPLRRAAVDLSAPGALELARAAALVVFARGPGPAELAAGSATLFELRGDKDHRLDAREVGADGDGRFVFDGLEPVEHAVLVEVPGHGFAFDARLVVQPGERHELTLELARGAWLEGFVRFPDGTPVPGVAVEVRPERQGLWSELEERVGVRLVTGADGAYRAESLGTGAHVVTLETPWGGEARKRVEIGESGRGVPLDFEVRRAARIEGVVVDGVGRAVPDAWVALAWEGRELFVPLGEEGARPGDGRRVARADEQGRFTFEDAPAGRTLRLFASDERPTGDAAAGHVLGLRLASNEERRDVELRLVHSARIRGRVQSLTGQPVSFVRVRAERDEDERTLRLSEARTDEAGAFELRGLSPGALRLDFDHRDFLQHVEPVQLSEQDTLELEVVLAREPVVHGIVRDAGGFAVPYARVDARCNEPAEVRYGRYSRRGAWADRYGRFSFDELGFGTWELSARAVGWREQAEPVVLELPAELWTELELEADPRPPRARVVGTLVREDGRPPTGVRFGSLRGGALQLLDGRFRVSGAAPGRMRIRVEADACVPAILGPFDLAPDDEHDVGLVVLQAGTRFSVELRDEKGARLRGARVRLSPLPVAEGGPNPTPKTLTLKETRPGRYAVYRTGLGRYRLRVDQRGFQRLAEEVEILEQPAQDQRIVLRAAEKGSGGKRRKPKDG